VYAVGVPVVLVVVFPTHFLQMKSALSRISSTQVGFEIEDFFQGNGAI
jgi:hypothetical protein